MYWNDGRIYKGEWLNNQQIGGSNLYLIQFNLIDSLQNQRSKLNAIIINIVFIKISIINTQKVGLQSQRQSLDGVKENKIQINNRNNMIISN